MSFLSFIDSVLSYIPANGDKTLIGLAGNSLVPVLVAAYPSAAIVAPTMTFLATLLTALGLFHKAVKAQLPAQS